MTGTMLPSEYVRELVYADEATRFITGRWPGICLTADARDIVHDERTEVTVIGATEDDFYPVVIAEGWAECCLRFGIMMRLPERQDDCWRWLNTVKADLARAGLKGDQHDG